VVLAAGVLLGVLLGVVLLGVVRLGVVRLGVVLPAVAPCLPRGPQPVPGAAAGLRGPSGALGECGLTGADAGRCVAASWPSCVAAW
jgi:hypothetical protein